MVLVVLVCAVHDLTLTHFLSSSGSVYSGKDIRTGAEVALKIARADQSPSRLSHKYNVYKSTAGSVAISPTRWYGIEGSYEVIVLDHLGTSLGDSIHAQQFDRRKTFFFASQFVRLFSTYMPYPTNFFLTALSS